MSNFQERLLIDYAPTVLREVREYQGLMSGEQADIFNLFSEIETALNNQFISTSTEYGVKRWEKMLGITPKGTYTLDERKFTILSRLAEELPFTYRMLERILTELCGENGFVMSLNNDQYELHVMVALTAIKNFDDVGALLKRVVPANIVIILTVELNQYYKLQPFTHADLTVKTHSQLRNEVL